LKKPSEFLIVKFISSRQWLWTNIEELLITALKISIKLWKEFKDNEGKLELNNFKMTMIITDCCQKVIFNSILSN
jgi:hypothetical protein